MKVIYLVPGSGEAFYCQNCLRDLALVKALRKAGVDAISVPLYLPLAAGEEIAGEGQRPVFYGAVRLYLENRLPWLSALPRGLRRWLDSPRLLRWASKRAGSTRARGLEQMTLSMLRGEEGRQASDLDQLIAWLKREGTPDVVHLSNALLLGLARRIRKELNTAVVCSLQDEDQWVDHMSPSSAKQAWALMAERAGDVDGFVAVSRYYAGIMIQRLRLPAHKVRTIPVGFELDGYEPASAAVDPPTIGYLSRMCESLGLGDLVEAFIKLRARPEFPRLRLRAMGGGTQDDRRFLALLRQRLARHGVEGDVEFLEGFDRTSRIQFLKSASVLSVPISQGEAFGAFQIEALAAGVPLVQPRVGAFTEIIEETGGGLLYDPADPAGLVGALAQVLLNPGLARDLAAKGRGAVLEKFTVRKTADATAEYYRELRSSKPS
jgi:glycosyltransferase involved in cell wall biosynthesis